MGWSIFIGIVCLFLIAVATHDLVQKKRPILRNFPIIGHGRYFFNDLGPKLRQYIVAGNNEERPFTRDQRHWVSASSNRSNNYFGFGTDNDLEQTSGYLIIKHNPFPIANHVESESQWPIPCAKVVGAARGRPGAFRPESIINISAMSFGSLSAHAVEALNRGAKMVGCLHNTGEGGISPHHDHGADLIWQLGTAYYGARDERGRFHAQRFVENCQRYNVRAVEIKLSQGAKPGHGGILPKSKITPEIAEIRGIPMGQDCVSPASHPEFSSADELLDFVERLAELSGLPIGIKSAVGEMAFWRELVQLMEAGSRGVDYVVIDGGEGGTGAAPLTFADHVALPFKIGMSRVFREFAERGVHENVVFVGSGKLGFPEQALLAMGMGCDWINVARTAMLSVGCIQAQICHTGRCPTGVATQNRWLMHGLDPTDKSARLANYVVTLRKEITELCYACGVVHPALITPDHFELLDDTFHTNSLKETFRLQGIPTSPSATDCETVRKLMQGQTNQPSP